MAERMLSNGTIWLSPPTMDDVDTITQCCRHPSIGEWVTIPVPYHREDAEEFIRNVVEQGWGELQASWGIRLRPDGPVVGMVGLNKTIGGSEDETAGSIGFWLVPQQRGRGLMTQAVRVVCDYGFGVMALLRIEWRAFVGNHPSAAVARRAGFRYEGLLRQGGTQHGVRRDQWVAGRLTTDPPDPVDWPPGI
jgi:RimJ/RimL family protein N-acetyltransferase